MAGGFHYYDIGHMAPLGGTDITLADTTARWKPGQQAFFNDQLGSRYAKYCKNISGGVYLQGELVAKAGNLNGQVVGATLTAGSTTHLLTTAQTAGFHEGALVYVLDNNDLAGGAPEGEIALARQNTTTRVDLDKKYPLSTALAVSDTVTFQATYCSQKAAGADNAGAVLGTVLPLTVADGAYFWAQQKGRGRVVTITGITVTVGLQAMVSATAGAAREVLLATTTQILKIGHFFLPISADIVNDYGWIDIRVDEFIESNSALALAA
jgi:hypothetical protein